MNNIYFPSIGNQWDSKIALNVFTYLVSTTALKIYGSRVQNDSVPM